MFVLIIFRNYKDLLKEIVKTLDIVDPKYINNLDDIMIEDLNETCPKFFKENVNLS